jgi:periplasmic protein CpxP/Spy
MKAMAGSAPKQTEKKRDCQDTTPLQGTGTISSSQRHCKEHDTMKPWIKRTLIGLTGVTVLVAGLSACGHRGSHHGQGWSEERITEVRGKAIERISDKLDLNAEQKAKLGALADQMIASCKAFRGNSDPRTDIQSLIASDKFDRTKAQQLLDQKLQAAQGNGPQMLNAFGDFYDSLNPEQQKQVREKLERRGHGWWGRG